MTQSPFACPLDGLPLQHHENSLRCENRHNFDISRYGYANLLPVQLKPSRDPGDSKAMINARRRVLESGLFKPLADAVASAIRNLRSTETASVAPGSLLLDAGCGEGYYTNVINEALAAGDDSVRVAGIDISRWAVTAAAKKYPHLDWAVANNKQPPVSAGQVWLISCLFGFPTWKPWATLQSPGQHVLVVDAGRDHLLQLRQQIYPEVRFHEPQREDEAQESGYLKTEETQVQFETTVDQLSLLQDLLQMTPHGSRAQPERLGNITQLVNQPLTISASVKEFKLLPNS
ncbi:MAG: methyltransferase domain-containing protein [Granulosicoccus sp.]|nr:methyltransferase domain-containing protein [Granulosicoccus sp.]